MYSQSLKVLNPYEVLKKAAASGEKLCIEKGGQGVKNILCILGLHRASKYDTYGETRIKGKHIWRVNYRVCKRCGKKL